MPFGLGFFATAGVRAAAGSFDLLETIVPTGSQSSIEFANLATAYSATYQHLQVRYTVRATAAANDHALVARFTSASGNHAAHLLFGNGSNASSINDPNSPHMYLNQFPAGNATANAFLAGVIDILDPFETTKYKTMRNFNGVASSINQVTLSSGFFYGSTAAISSFILNNANGGNFSSLSRFSLYGIKAA